MGQTFVYNTGSSKDDIAEDEIELKFGVFIDGTLNNKTNTEKRVQYRNHNAGVKITDEQRAEAKERVNQNYPDGRDANGMPITDTKRRELEDKEVYRNLTDGQIDESVKQEEYDYAHIDKITDPEYKKYLIAAHRTDEDKKGTNNSYSNDYTNIARMWSCCSEEYAIYVDGMGTEELVRDIQDGFAFGSGTSGIRAKVRKGCELLADKIIREKKNNGTKVITKVTLDVFGFSRGAASARNFVYEVNHREQKKLYAPTVADIPDGVVVDNEGHIIQKFRKATVDKDLLEVDSSVVLFNGYLPPLGHLGNCLMKNKKMTLTEVGNITIEVRFLGVYESVSSYFEWGGLGDYTEDGKLVDDLWFKSKGAYKKLKEGGKNDPFYLNKEQLHLNDFGNVKQIVHFTAQDEHRVNFDLTLMPGANKAKSESGYKIVEKNFPGVHCDIGGAYENESEKKLEIETSNHQKDLDGFRQTLINEKWFSDEQIWKKEDTLFGWGWLEHKVLKGLTTYEALYSNRPLRKEYSYIPLHFMEQFCRQSALDEHFVRKTEAEYKIDDHPILVQTKKKLAKYVFDTTGDEKPWKFESDEEIKRKMEAKQAEKDFLESLKPPKKPIPYINEGDNVPVIEECPVETVPDATELSEVVVTSYSKQGLLRKLRGEYLHWSAHRKWFGMEPHENRVRTKH
jgi:Uncharacterized alpha/beta hydrolase domain (DUF2235)